MLIALIFLGLCFILCTINYAQFRTVLNYPNVFIVLWCIVTALSGFGFYDFFVPPGQVYVYIALMLFVFEIATIFSLHVKLKSIQWANKSIEEGNDVAVDYGGRIIFLLCVLCTVIVFPLFIKSFTAAMTSGYYYVRVRILSNEFFTTIQRLMLQDIVQPITIVALLISIYRLVEDREITATSILAFINCFLYTLALGNRSLLMEIIYIAVVILGAKYRLNLIEILKKNKKIVFAALTLIAVLAFITSQRSISGGKGLVYNIYSYFVGSIHLFGVAVNNPKEFLLDGTGLLYGKELFSALFSFTDNVMSILGINVEIQSGMGIINEVIQQYYYVSPTTHMNNNVTMLYGFMRDFGVLGIIIDTFVLALLYMHWYKKRNRSIWDKYTYYFAVSLIPYYIFEWILGRTYILTVFLILLVLKWARSKKVRLH